MQEYEEEQTRNVTENSGTRGRTKNRKNGDNELRTQYK
jgi:hypothetical protein